jgi:NAD(P)-dependent dehydrogenase (short-subunit alcohol dehydrogenase family)
MASSAVTQDFSGKKVLITGGSRGLGRAMAMGFARAGADLAIASRKREACEAVVAEIGALHRRASAHAAHVGRWEDCARLVDEVYGAMGRIDVLINNAGMSPLAASSAETSEELWDKVLSVNLKGPFRLTALAASRMVASGRGGAVINISSIASLRPTPETAPYSAAKAGLNALTLAFAKEYAPSVRVNAILAGPFLTDVSKLWASSPAFAERKQRIPLRRAGNPDEIVGAALYLASEAASYTTGALLTVDGGAWQA